MIIRTFCKNSYVTTFGANLFIQMSTIMQGIVIARILGPEGRGDFAAVLLWPTFFAAIFIFGSNIALAKSAAKSADLVPFFRTTLLISFMTGSLACLSCYISLPLLFPCGDKELVAAAKLFVFFIPLNHFAVNLSALDQGSGRFGIYNLTRVILNPFYLLLIIILWLSGHGTVYSFTLALLFANLLVVCLRLWLWLKEVPFFGDWHSISETVYESVRFGIAGIVEALYAQADKALMLWLLGAKNLGFYAVALSASMAISSITSSAGMVVFTESAKAERGKGFWQVTKVFRISLILWCVCGLLLSLMMPFLLPFVYGKDFIPAISPAQLLIVGAAFAGLSGLLEQSLRGQGRAFIGISGKVAALIVMLIIGSVLAPQYGIHGVCVSYLLAQFICLLVLVVKNNTHYQQQFSLAQYVPYSFEDICSMLFIKDKRN